MLHTERGREREEGGRKLFLIQETIYHVRRSKVKKEVHLVGSEERGWGKSVVGRDMFECGGSMN